MLFAIIRLIIGCFGALLVVGALLGVPYAASDHAWGPAIQIAISGLFGVWFIRIGANGTFSGNRPDRSASNPIRTK